MSIVTIATSKGGAGKTTLAQILAGSFAGGGYRVAAIDADYNHTLSDWVRMFGGYPIDIRAELDEKKIINLADTLEREHDLVVIDTAGAAMQATVFAIGCADLVLIPCQLSSADVVEAVKTKQLVDSAATMTKRTIPVRAVLTDYQPNTIIAGHVERELSDCNLEPIATRLHRLVAFKEMTFNGRVPSEGTAGTQVASFADDVATLLSLPAMQLAS